MTVPQIAAGLALLLQAASQCNDPTRIARDRTRRLQRNELAKLYHWHARKRLPPLNINKRQL